MFLGTSRPPSPHLAMCGESQETRSLRAASHEEASHAAALGSSQGPGRWVPQEEHRKSRVSGVWHGVWDGGVAEASGFTE